MTKKLNQENRVPLNILARMRPFTFQMIAQYSVREERCLAPPAGGEAPGGAGWLLHLLVLSLLGVLGGDLLLLDARPLAGALGERRRRLACARGRQRHLDALRDGLAGDAAVRGAEALARAAAEVAGRAVGRRLVAVLGGRALGGGGLVVALLLGGGRVRHHARLCATTLQGGDQVVVATERPHHAVAS